MFIPLKMVCIGIDPYPYVKLSEATLNHPVVIQYLACRSGDVSNELLGKNNKNLKGSWTGRCLAKFIAAESEKHVYIVYL